MKRGLTEKRGADWHEEMIALLKNKFGAADSECKTNLISLFNPAL
jgi:hypothetical protein